MAKQLLYTDEARKKLLAGADKLAHAVGVTLGPTGRNVILDKSFGGPTVTKDGVTVSKEIDLADPNPPQIITFWLYTHPPLAERLVFAHSYDPWSKGSSPKYVKPSGE